MLHHKNKRKHFAAVSLAQLSARKSQQAVRGIVGSKSQAVGDKLIQVQRTNGEAFYAFLTDTFGWEQFCSERSIPHDAAALSLVEQACLDLEISESFREETLEQTEARGVCPCPYVYATGRARCLVKTPRSLPLTFMRQPVPLRPSGWYSAHWTTRRKSKSAMRTLPSLQAESKFVPAPNTAETLAIIAFRNQSDGF